MRKQNCCSKQATCRRSPLSRVRCMPASFRVDTRPGASLADPVLDPDQGRLAPVDGTPQRPDTQAVQLARRSRRSAPAGSPREDRARPVFRSSRSVPCDLPLYPEPRDDSGSLQPHIARYPPPSSWAKPSTAPADRVLRVALDRGQPGKHLRPCHGVSGGASLPRCQASSARRLVHRELTPMRPSVKVPVLSNTTMCLDAGQGFQHGAILDQDAVVCAEAGSHCYGHGCRQTRRRRDR